MDTFPVNEDEWIESVTGMVMAKGISEKKKGAVVVGVKLALHIHPQMRQILDRYNEVKLNATIIQAVFWHCIDSQGGLSACVRALTRESHGVNVVVGAALAAAGVALHDDPPAGWLAQMPANVH